MTTKEQTPEIDDLDMQIVRVVYRGQNGKRKAAYRRVIKSTSADRHHYLHLKKQAFVSIGQNDVTFYSHRSGAPQIVAPVLSLQLLASRSNVDLWRSDSKCRRPKFLKRLRKYKE